MSIDTNKQFDQVFKEKLQNYEEMPPESVWENIQDSGLGASSKKSSQWRWWAAASVLALLLSSSAYVYFNDDLGTASQNNNLSSPSNSMVISDVNSKADNNEQTVKENTNQQHNNFDENENSSDNQPLVATSEDIDEVNQMIFQENDIIEDVNPLGNNDKEIFEEHTTETPQTINIINNQNINTNEFASRDIQAKEDDTQPTIAGRDFFDDDATDEALASRRKEKYWMLGVEFSPQWITIPENSNDIRSYGLDFSAKYYINKMFFETGIGVAFNQDNGDYKVEYLDAIFKGAYEDVYDVTFDEVDGEIVPTYFTSTVNVYDTIEKVSVEEVKNTYIYLNIPLNVGYAFKLSERFNLYAKTGLNAGIKVYENIPEPTVSGENTTIKRLTPLYHKRTDWNLQAQINVGIDYRITPKFLFGIEPSAHYYLKSLVENNEAGNPYGYGVKLGFKYILK